LISDRWGRREVW